MKVLFKLCLLLLVFGFQFLVSTKTMAEEPKCSVTTEECANIPDAYKKAPTNESELKNIIDNYTQEVSITKYISEEEYCYVLCFQIEGDASIELTQTISVATELNKPLAINGLKMGAGKYDHDNNNWTALIDYTGLLLSIPGNNVTLNNLTISDAKDAVKITGNNVTIENSTISASHQAITISNADNVTIKNSNIKHVGEQSAGSAGVYVESSSNVNVIENSAGIEDFVYGVYIDSMPKGILVKETNFKIADPQKAIFWELGGDKVVDVGMVGKKVDGTTGKVTELIGLAPVGVCSDQEVNNGKVIYYSDDSNQSGMIVYEKECSLVRTEEAFVDCLQFEKSEYSSNEDCVQAGDCLCFDVGSCKFECSGLALDNSSKLVIGFSDAIYNSHKLSSHILLSILDDIRSTIEFISEEGSTTGVVDNKKKEEPIGGDSIDVTADNKQKFGDTTTDIQPNGGDLATSAMGGCSLVESTPPVPLNVLLFVFIGFLVAGAGLLRFARNDNKWYHHHPGKSPRAAPGEVVVGSKFS